MTHVRDLALFEKWTDPSLSPALPSLSPTSPKATNFCCCPHRRRYNLIKPSRKQRQNFFVENEFIFTDDATVATVAKNETPKAQFTSTNNNNNNNDHCVYVTCERTGIVPPATQIGSDVEAVASHQLIINESGGASKRQRSMPVSDTNPDTENTIAINQHSCTRTRRGGEEEAESVCTGDGDNRGEQWNQQPQDQIHRKHLELSNESDRKDQCCVCPNQAPAKAITENTAQQRQRQHQRSEGERYNVGGHDHCGKDVVDSLPQIIDRKNTIAVADDAATTAITKTRTEENHFREKQPAKQIQRLSSNNNINNKVNKISYNSENIYKGESNSSNNHQFSIKNTITYNDCCQNKNNCCNSCQLRRQQQQQQQQPCFYKMTVATITPPTTTATYCNFDENGLRANDIIANTATTSITPTTPTTPSSAATPTTPITPTIPITPTTSSTPSVTVIKTTMVKRTPNDTKSPTETTTKVANFEAAAPTITTDAAVIPTAIATATASATVITIQKGNLRSTQKHQEQQQHASNKCDDITTATTTTTVMQEPLVKSVKERIAAFAAGRDQTNIYEYNNNTNNNKFRKSQCQNNNVKNLVKAVAPSIKGSTENGTSTTTITTTTTTATTIAIGGIMTTETQGSITAANNNNNRNTNNFNSHKRNASPASTASQSSLGSAGPGPGTCSGCGSGSGFASASASASPTPSASSDIPCTEAAIIGTTLTNSTGAATMPRCSRSPTILADRSSKYGNKSAAIVAIPTTANRGNPETAYQVPAPDDSVTKNLSTLDNLDLALSLNLNADAEEVDEGDDPYYALQEYLERVKHEINEVFELHKARQRIQQQEQQQQHQQQQSWQPDQQVDELARSIESDSGFDSASGHNLYSLSHNSSNNNANDSTNELSKRATTTNKRAATIFEKVTEINNTVNSLNNANGPTISSTLAASSPSSPSPTILLTDDAATVGTDDKQIMQFVNGTVTTTLINNSNNNRYNNRDDNNDRDRNDVADDDVKSAGTSTSPSTIIRLRQELQAKASSDEVNIWANKFLRDLDTLMGTNKTPASASSTALISSAKSAAEASPPPTPLLLSAAAMAAINGRINGSSSKTDEQRREHQEHREQSHTSGFVPKPLKHATIPLQSFNLDGGGFVESSNSTTAITKNNNTNNIHSNTRSIATNVAYLRTLSAPSISHNHQYQLQQQHQPHQHQPLPSQSSPQQQQHMQQFGDNGASMTNNSTNYRSLATLQGEQYFNSNNNNNSNNSLCCCCKPQQQKRPLTPEPMTILKIEEATAATATTPISSNEDLLAFNSDAGDVAGDDGERSGGGIRDGGDENDDAYDGGRSNTQFKPKAESGTISIADEELYRQRRQRQLENDMETIRNDLVNRNLLLTAMEANSHNNNKSITIGKSNSNGGSNTNSNNNNVSNMISSINSALKNTTVASPTSTAASLTFVPKRERINHAGYPVATSATAPITIATTKATPSTRTSAESSLGVPTSAILMTPSKIYSSPAALSTTTTTTAATAVPSAATTTVLTATTSSLLNGCDATKKGSTSTIWTSEESILRSVGAVDEDNNSTSSSACEEASGALSSGKSGISLDSSGLDNDNNESGIGTATPPKDLSYWKNAHHNHHHRHHQNDNGSVSSLDAVRKMKCQKANSVASSDDPDLLEVLSLCDEPQGDEDICANVDESLTVGDTKHHRLHRTRQFQQEQKQSDQQKQQVNREYKLRANDTKPSHGLLHQTHEDEDVEENDADGDVADVDIDDMDDDEVDEVHDDFEIVTYCDCNCGDGDASSSSTGAACNGRPRGEGERRRDSEHEGVSSATPRVGGSAGSNNSSSCSSNSIGDSNGVVLRRKFNAAPPIMVPYGRAQKCRSHSLDTASLPTSLTLHHHHHHHQQQQQQQFPLHHNQHHNHSPYQHHQYHSSQLTRKLYHLHNSRTKERVQLSLALRQEPFQSLLSPSQFHDLPSPSSASLHSGHESLGIQELTTKSNSAPLLLKQERKRDDFAAQNLTLRYSRSQSDRYLAEIEAVEACKWLRAAGFPQYAQMYEDQQFPIDLTNVAKDHTNLENDQLQSLYRRLCILNRCANMRLDQSHKAQTPQKEDSDDENFALSENWTFQPHIRRWSRIGEMGLELPPACKLNIEKVESSSKESSPDRFEDDAYNSRAIGLTLLRPGVDAPTDGVVGVGGVGMDGGGSGGVGGGGGGDSTDTTLNDVGDPNAVRLRRTGSERFKDGAKALLRRVESIKSRRRKRQNREGIVISGPQALDLTHFEQRSSLRKPDVIYSTPPSPSAVSPMHTFPKSPFFGNELKIPLHSESFLSPNRSSPKRVPAAPRSMRVSPLHFFANPMPHLREGKSDDSSSYFSDSQESSAGGKLTPSLRKTPSKARRFLQRTGKVDDIGAHSDSECHHGRKLLIKDANLNTTEVKVKKLSRGGSLNLGKDHKKRDGLRSSSSFRSRSSTRKDARTTDDADHAKRTPVVRWHSFQMEERPHMVFRKCFGHKIDSNVSDQGAIPFAAMSAGQLQIIRKLALVVLTGYMERHCPTHRSGWNWELPKFIKKIKMPDYKDKKVFGVPLLLILQRTGQTLPIAVRSAFRWLQLNALDQIGLFRKSGVKSRIIKLKELIEYSESQAECMNVFDSQQAYDVADMLKQYFRDLPESLLTTKMSETFATIFQHLPADIRLDAVQCAVLLLPDENREILHALLEFLTLVANNAKNNQMTANNLAVCLAPSLFHNSISTGSASVTASPRRRGKGTGVPDVKELSEAKASHECLAFMIENYRKIYTASKDKINKCNFGYMEESKPVPLEALGEGMQFHNWRGYLYECTSATIKEGREKTRGWFSITSVSDPAIDIAYKKVGDGHPLRLWRCITEVEGPPKDVLQYILRQRASWDTNLLQSQTLKKLDERTEVFHYIVDGQLTTDFCVLRSWQTDLPRGACVIVETSIEHSKAKSPHGSVRGVVLASRYLIEPCGSGRSRVMHLARVDIKGKTPEWYNKSYGHICSHYLSRIRNAFKNVADGPESKI